MAPLVGKLQEMALSEAKALVSVNGDIRRLRDRLMWMQAFLQHTDPRRRDVSNELVGVWLKQTRDVAFDAEDALDHYFRRIDLSRYNIDPPGPLCQTKIHLCSLEGTLSLYTSHIPSIPNPTHTEFPVPSSSHYIFDLSLKRVTDRDPA